MPWLLSPGHPPGRQVLATSSGQFQAISSLSPCRFSHPYNPPSQCTAHRGKPWKCSSDHTTPWCFPTGSKQTPAPHHASRISYTLVTSLQLQVLPLLLHSQQTGPLGFSSVPDLCCGLESSAEATARGQPALAMEVSAPTPGPGEGPASAPLLPPPALSKESPTSF